MSTRSRAKAAANAASNPSTSVQQQQPPKQQPKPKGRPRKSAQPTKEEVTTETANQVEKENVIVKTVKRKGKPQRGKGKRGKATTKKEYCLCKKGDDGTPMVHCGECKDWRVLLSRHISLSFVDLAHFTGITLAVSI